MKKLMKILSYILAGAVIILGLVMAVIEGRILFSGDWLLHQSPLFALIRYAIRFLLSLISIAGGVATYIKRLEAEMPFISIIIATITLASCPFITNYLNIALPIIGCLFALVTVGANVNKCK